MWLTFFVVTFLVLFLLGLALQALLLWLGAKVVKIPAVRYRRALWTCVVMSAVGLPIQIGIVLCEWWWMDALARMPLGVQLMPAALLVGVTLVVPWLCVKWLLRATLGRAALATLIMLVGSFAVGPVLALSFRHAVAEAFVIPTGAMAPTVYGAHADLTCENCGFGYAVSMSQWAPGSAGRPREAVPAACPNCGHTSEVPVRDPVLSGDRILVEKIARPQRWDLIVFKYPEEPSTNFIKRLVGLPGETLEIVEGDIFIDGKRLRKPPGTAEDMWLLDHDNGYVAKQALPEGPRWQPSGSSSHWNQTAGKWVFTGTDVEGDALWFSGRLTDELAYNGQQTDWGPPDAPPPPLAGDIKVECCTDGFSGKGGSLAFRWEFAEQRVTATISTWGAVEIVSSVPAARAVKGQGEQKTSGDLTGDMDEKQRLAFCFRDGQAHVMQDGAVVASLVVGPQDVQTAKDRVQPDTKPCRVEIVASRCLVTLSRIRVWKDVYYRSLEEVTGELDYVGPQWGSTGHPVVLGPDEHFTLGDNSARSKDSRFWGTVGSDQIIGVARWIYWPRSRWHEFQ